MTTRKTIITDEDDVDKIHDQYYKENYYNSRSSSNWVAILLVALFMVGILAIFPYMMGNRNNIQNTTNSPAVTTQPDSSQPGPQFGVGGGPDEATATPTPTTELSSTVTPLAPPMNLETTREPTP